jgi:hypothetical protein
MADDSNRDIRHMFDLLDAEPSPEFVSGLRTRLMDVTSQGATATAVAEAEEDLIMTITESGATSRPHPTMAGGALCAGSPPRPWPQASSSPCAGGDS